MVMKMTRGKGKRTHEEEMARPSRQAREEETRRGGRKDHLPQPLHSAGKDEGDLLSVRVEDEKGGAAKRSLMCKTIREQEKENRKETEKKGGEKNLPSSTERPCGICATRNLSFQQGKAGEQRVKLEREEDQGAPDSGRPLK